MVQTYASTTTVLLAAAATAALASVSVGTAAFALTSPSMGLVAARTRSSSSSSSRVILFEDAVATAVDESSSADGDGPAADPPFPTYVKSRSLPFLEYPINLAGYVGDAGFDPFRFSDFLPMDYLRESEIKHGRICMMAVAGFAAVDLGLRVYPTPEAYQGLTSVTAHDALVEQGAMGQMLLWFSLAEIIDTIAIIQMLQGSGREPGDFGFDPLRIMNTSKEKQDDWKLRELTNGRLAMVAFSGMVTQAVLTQGPFPYV